MSSAYPSGVARAMLRHKSNRVNLVKMVMATSDQTLNTARCNRRIQAGDGFYSLAHIYGCAGVRIAYHSPDFPYGPKTDRAYGTGTYYWNARFTIGSRFSRKTGGGGRKCHGVICSSIQIDVNILCCGGGSHEVGGTEHLFNRLLCSRVGFFVELGITHHLDTGGGAIDGRHRNQRQQHQHDQRHQQSAAALLLDSCHDRYRSEGHGISLRPAGLVRRTNWF